MSLWHNLRWKLAATAALAVVVFFAGGAIGFPLVFRWYLVGYVLLALPFFVLLDLHFSTETPKRPGLAILVVFLLASAVLLLSGYLLPQFDPAAEQEKIARVQQGYVERQQATQIAELATVAAGQGLALVPTEQVGVAGGGVAGGVSTPVAEATLDPALVERGKIAYQDWECYNCHKIGGEGGVKRRGPELDSVGLIMSAEALRAELLDPRSSLSVGFEEEYDKVTMPDDFGNRMSPSEIEALVAYMRSLTSTEIQSPAVEFPGMAEDPDMSPFYDILLEYQKFMPEGWWTDEKVIAAGKDIYTGVTDSAVVCAACHGTDGRPVLTGAADLTDLDFWESLSEPYLYWRVAAGVPDTPMTAFGMPPAMATSMPGMATMMPGTGPTPGKLTEEQIWQVLAYINTLAYGEPTPHVLYPAKAFKP